MTLGRPAGRQEKPPRRSPWGRYANPESARWKDDKQTGGVVFLLYFFDELIRLGHRGANGEIVEARDAGRGWLRDGLLPHWTVNDVWGRNYWDWADPVQAETSRNSPPATMDNKDQFPNWRNDARNILSLFLNHERLPEVGGRGHSARAFPESGGCCGRSLWYGPMEVAVPFAQLGVEAQDAWATELARRMQILARMTGMRRAFRKTTSTAGLSSTTAGSRSRIRWPRRSTLLATIAWMPEQFAPRGEPHWRSTAVVDSVAYAGRSRLLNLRCPARHDDRAPPGV